MPRISKPSSIDLQERDITLLRRLFEARQMTLNHFAGLYFNGSYEAAKKRVQKLERAGYLRKRTLNINKPASFFLTKSALEYLLEDNKHSDYPKVKLSALLKRTQPRERTIHHENDVMDFVTALTSVLRSHQTIELHQAQTWPLLFEFSFADSRGLEKTAKPDAYIACRERAMGSGGNESNEFNFFVEIDRSNETQDRVADKLSAYRIYYQSGGFAEWIGASAEEYKTYPFRVLMLFISQERRNNAAEKILQQTNPSLTMVWLAVFEEFIENPLGRIWIRPIDYRKVTAGSKWDPEKRRNIDGYRTDVAREKMVEEKILKHEIFD